MLSMATDYSHDIHAFNSMADMANGVGNPDKYLRAIADAGFSHVHWCHHWSGDFMYGDSEIEHIAGLLKKYGLQVADVHASEGKEKFWYSPQEYARLAGVELVKNRIDFCKRLGGDAIVMHAYPLPADKAMAEFVWGQLRKSLDALQPYAVERGVKITIENLVDFQSVAFEGAAYADVGDNWGLIEDLFAVYSAEFLTLCYDSGHGNLGYDRMDGLEKVIDRLSVLHLNSNDGSGDQHHNIFTDPIDWQRLAKLIAQSDYTKPMSLEVVDRNLHADEAEFLNAAVETGNRFSAMVDAARK